MAEIDNANVQGDDDQPIAVRRKRRSSTTGPGGSRSSNINSHGIHTPPATPSRSKKRVRFSDPGPGAIESELGAAASTGLTPFVRRTIISSPSTKRRHSNPVSLWSLSPNDAPISGTLQFEPLRQVLDGRVKRRLRRNKLSEEFNDIQADQRQEAKRRKTEMEKLRDALEAKDIEMQSMRDELDLASQLEGESGAVSNTVLTAKVQDLEKQIRDLKAELERSEEVSIQHADWTLTARDPYQLDEDEHEHDHDMTIMNDDYDFTNMMDDEIMTTPRRLNTSFPSPPSTMPNTPCKAPAAVSAGVQVSLTIPDPEKDLLRTQLSALQSEISALTSSMAFTEDHQLRLKSKLSDYLPTDEESDNSLDAALDTVLTQLALTQAQSQEHSDAFSALSSEIKTLGYSSCVGPEETLALITAQFRKARLELEYLTPGEVVEGFENEKLLDMLITRLRVLVRDVKEKEDSIDQYHEQEVLLRQQLGTRIDVHRQAERDLLLATEVVGGLRREVEDKEIGNQRLSAALEGYRAEVKGLETLIENVEKEARSQEAILQGEVNELEERLQDEVLKHDTTRSLEEGNRIVIMELERRLTAALQAATEVQEQLQAVNVANTTKDHDIAEIQASRRENERQHDIQISGLQLEMEQLNNALEAARSTIVSLRETNHALKTELEGEKTQKQSIIQAMRKLLETGMGFINGGASPVQASSVEFGATFGPLAPLASSATSESCEPTEIVVRRGRFLDGSLARRRSSGMKKRRKYDSGLGFLEEEEGEDTVIGADM